MLEQFLSALPQQPAPATTVAGLAGASAGGVLWLFGSRFSRSLLTLVLVSLGAWVGLRLPQWLALPVAGWATAIGAALVLGISGYAMHRLWVGLGLALLSAFWAAVFVVAAYGTGDVSWRPIPEVGPDLIGHGRQLWEALPADLQRAGPFACGLAVCSALAIAILWARLACFLFHSLLGVTLLLTLGAVAVGLLRPQWLMLVPAQRTAQVAILAGMVLFGAIAQWRMAPKLVAEPPRSVKVLDD